MQINKGHGILLSLFLYLIKFAESTSIGMLVSGTTVAPDLIIKKQKGTV